MYGISKHAQPEICTLFSLIFNTRWAGCFVLGDNRVQLDMLPWIQTRIVGMTSQIQTSLTASFTFSSIISALSNLCPSARVTSLANSRFYLRTVLFGTQDNCAYSDDLYGPTIFSSTSPASKGPPGCNGTDPNFVQWANISCDINCTCMIIANGRMGHYGSNEIVGSGKGCSGAWQVTNGWETGTSGNYQQGVFFGGISLPVKNLRLSL